MVLTYKNKFNKKYKFSKDQSHSIEDISKITGYKLSGLKIIFSKGIGAFRTNRSQVRPQIKSPQAWGISRIYSSVMGGKAAKIDKQHLIKEK